MRITELKDITYKKEVITGCKCDVCNKEIKSRQNYWRLTTHHNDWGNDSIDSYEHYDLCSPECIKVKLNEYYKECENSNTQCFELKQDRLVYYNK